MATGNGARSQPQDTPKSASCRPRSHADAGGPISALVDAISDLLGLPLLHFGRHRLVVRPGFTRAAHKAGRPASRRVVFGSSRAATRPSEDH